MTPGNDGGGWGVLAGFSVFLVQLFVLAPGLLPLVLLTLAFALPLLVLAVPVLLLWALVAVVRAAGNAARRGRRPGALG